jgi:hypothetical protein
MELVDNICSWRNDGHYYYVWIMYSL